MTTWMISGILGFVAGGAFIWFGRTTIEKAVLGANALAAKLHAKADAIAGTIRKI